MKPQQRALPQSKNSPALRVATNVLAPPRDPGIDHSTGTAQWLGNTCPAT
ncbi:hypothetical protein [Streptomyces sp. NPDC053427]